jgi:putative lipoic acid-binding regulatory protein
MGLATDDFDALVAEIVIRHVGDINEGAVAVRASRNGKYVSVTVTFEAQGQDQLDELYRELSGHERILMVL